MAERGENPQACPAGDDVIEDYEVDCLEPRLPAGASMEDVIMGKVLLLLWCLPRRATAFHVLFYS